MLLTELSPVRKISRAWRAGSEPGNPGGGLSGPIAK